jgi:hypothetical protein
VFRRSRRFSGSGASLCWGEKVMALTMSQKHGLFWVLGIVAGLTLMTVAWAQITDAICYRFAFF